MISGNPNCIKVMSLILVFSFLLIFQNSCSTTDRSLTLQNGTRGRGLSSSHNLRNIIRSYFSKTENINFIGNVRILKQFTIDTRSKEINSLRSIGDKISFKQITIANLISVDTLSGKMLSCVYESRPIFSPQDANSILVRGTFFNKATDVSEALALILPSKPIPHADADSNNQICMDNFKIHSQEFFAFVKTILKQNILFNIEKKSCTRDANCHSMGKLIPKGQGVCLRQSGNYGTCAARSIDKMCIPQKHMFTPHMPTKSDLENPKGICL